jgi:hypothetical protein
MDSKGIPSPWSTNAEPFTIANHPPNPVLILTPTSGQFADDAVVIAWAEAQPKDWDGHPVTYNIEVTSRFSTGTSWVNIPDAIGLPSGTTNFTADISNLPPGSDYGFRVTAVDTLGLGMPSLPAGPVSIGHIGQFIVDTLPPSGTLVINDGAALAGNQITKLTMNATDVTTGVAAFRMMNATDAGYGLWEPYTATTRFWSLPQADGIQTVFVQYMDFAGNISQACNCKVVNSVMSAEGNVTDLAVYGDSLFSSYDTNGNLMQYKVLAKSLDIAEQLNGSNLTALASFNSALYIAAWTPGPPSETTIYMYDGTPTAEIVNQPGKVLTMQSYLNNLYIGMDNGSILEYTGSGTPATVYPLVAVLPPAVSPAVTRLRTDGNLLYAALEGVTEFLSFDGSTWMINQP